MSTAASTPGRRLRRYLLVCGGGLLVLLYALFRLADQPVAVHQVDGEWVADRGQYAGAGACRDCHGAIVEAQERSNHARTIRDLSREKPDAPFDTGQVVTDPYTGVRYAMRTASGRPEITVSAGEVTARSPLAFEFGSGSIAHGYLVALDRKTWLDTRLNYYASIRAWDFTSGQVQPLSYLKTHPSGRPVTGGSAARCFACHSTVLRAENVGKAPADGSQLVLRPDHSVLGVTCEACHGPRGDHVREQKSGKAPPRPAPLTADDQNRVCGRCHGLDKVDPAHPVIARFEPWGLSQSRCFRASAGRLSCTTCHDPHGNASRDALFYEAKCLSCHTGASSSVMPEVAKLCPVNAKTGCVKCHMPADSKTMLHTTLTDHRIRIQRDETRTAQR